MLMMMLSDETGNLWQRFSRRQENMFLDEQSNGEREREIAVDAWREDKSHNDRCLLVNSRPLHSRYSAVQVSSTN